MKRRRRNKMTSCMKEVKLPIFDTTSYSLDDRSIEKPHQFCNPPRILRSRGRQRDTSALGIQRILAMHPLHNSLDSNLLTVPPSFRLRSLGRAPHDPPTQVGTSFTVICVSSEPTQHQQGTSSSSTSPRWKSQKPRNIWAGVAPDFEATHHPPPTTHGKPFALATSTSTKKSQKCQIP